MLGRTYENEICSIAWTLEIAGERWSFLILRNALFGGMTRFSDFQRSLGIAPNILTRRLGTFVKEGILTKSGGDEYHLTPKGLDLKPALMALRQWGDRWAAPHGPPAVILHEGCGGEVRMQLRCKACSTVPKLEDLKAQGTEAIAVYQKERDR